MTKPYSNADLSVFADLAVSISSSGEWPHLPLSHLETENALVRLGINPVPAVLDLIVSMRIRHAAPLHLDLARKIAADPIALREIQGVPLDEFLIDLMGFEYVRQRLTRRFFKSFHRYSEQEEPLWWAAEDLDQALNASVIKVGYIHSTKGLLREGKRAQQRLLRAGISLGR